MHLCTTTVCFAHRKRHRRIVHIFFTWYSFNPWFGHTFSPSISARVEIELVPSDHLQSSCLGFSTGIHGRRPGTWASFAFILNPWFGPSLQPAKIDSANNNAPRPSNNTHSLHLFLRLWATRTALSQQYRRRVRHAVVTYNRFPFSFTRSIIP